MDAREIKVGDRVKCIDATFTSLLTLNAIYTAERIDRLTFPKKFFRFKEIRESHFYKEKRFVLFEGAQNHPLTKIFV